MKKLMVLIFAMMMLATIFTANHAWSGQAYEYDYLFSGLLGKWVLLYQDGKDIPITITFESQGIGTTGFNFSYLDMIAAPRNDMDGDIRLFVPHETRFFWAVAGDDMVTNGEGEILEYLVIKIWLPPESELISINILPLGEGKIAIFGDDDDGKMFFFYRPRLET